jgi:hypothetical protein
MVKNGKLFISIINDNEFISSVWDPYVYRRNGNTHMLSHYATVQKVSSKPVSVKSAPFKSIEYNNIPRGNYLSFALERRDCSDSTILPVVGEGFLLFGTMRAYIGNIIVTPLAEWINLKSPLYFQVKSEFVIISPRDELTYFWFAYMRSKIFLENLPLGTGGTRPRLNINILNQTPVKVPSLETRKKIHEKLKELAKIEWLNYRNVASTFNTLSA